MTVAKARAFSRAIMGGLMSAMISRIIYTLSRPSVLAVAPFLEGVDVFS